MLACYAEAVYRCSLLPSFILGLGLKYLTGIGGSLAFFVLDSMDFDLLFYLAQYWVSFAIYRLFLSVKI